MRRLIALFTLLLVCVFPARAWAHASDEDYTLTTTCDLFDDRLEQTVYIPAWFLMNELYGEQTMLAGLAEKEADCRASVTGWMAYNNPVLADGETVRPEVVAMEARSNAWPENRPFPGFAKGCADADDNLLKHTTGVKILLRYPLKAAPQTVSVRWRRFIVRNTTDGALAQPPVSLAFFHDDKHRITDLTAAEPEWVWHSSAVAAAPETALISQKWEPVVWVIPAGALLAVFGGLAGASVLWRKNRAVAVAVLLAGLGAGAYAWQAGIGAVRTDSPFQKQPARPDGAQARVILDGLLHGVYRAFDHNKDAQIYDALAHCVDGPLLEKIYRDVHGSLVLDDTEGGGAVCQVEKVDVTGAELKPAGSGETGTLVLHCAWQVRGKVSHWGHTHVRANAYEADCTLAPCADAGGQRWKITGCAVTAEKPLEEQTQTPPATAPDSTVKTPGPGNP